MKKVFTILSEVFLIVAAALIVVGAVLGFIPEATTTGGQGASLAALSGVAIGTFTILFVGMFLRHNKNDIARNIGRALILAAFLTVGVYSIGAIITMPYFGAAAIVGLIALILFGIHYVFELVLWIIARALKDKETEETK